MQFTFDQGKAVVIVHYVIQKLQRPSVSRIFKLLYLADKTSLESYGRFLCGETYEARKYGPVPKNISTWIVPDKDNKEYGFNVNVDGVDLHLQQDPDLEELSDSDIACIDEVIKLFGTVPMWWLTQVSKDFAYLAAWKYSSDPRRPISIGSIVELLEYSTELLEHLQTSPHIHES